MMSCRVFSREMLLLNQVSEKQGFWAFTLFMEVSAISGPNTFTT
jgi:hypothetical protein